MNPSSSSPVLLVDDEPQMLLSSSMILRSAGIKDVVTMEDSREVLPFLIEQGASAIVLDLSMPYVPGAELLTEINHGFPEIPVIVMTATNELGTAVACMKSGAFDYLVKPVEKDHFVSTVQKALELHTLRREISSLKEHLLTDQLEEEAAFSSIIAKSRRMRALFHYVEAVAGSQQPVLITGETGVGKELIARSVHTLSRREGKLIAVNVAGLDDTMFSDTLFGHQKGAYTGAEQGREGLIAQAAGGTLFLDEIGDLKESSQMKLLRLLQEQTYYPLGSDRPQKSDARIVVATNQDLQKLISEKKFRKDLYYRLRAHQIHIPPLRERFEDLPLLIDHFLEDTAEKLNRKKPALPPELIMLLSNYSFPGNVRELQSMVFDAMTRHKSGILSMTSFKEAIGEERSQTHGGPPPADDANLLNGLPGSFPTLKEAEHHLISEALKTSKGNQGIAASLLGISRQALNKRLSRNGKTS